MATCQDEQVQVCLLSYNLLKDLLSLVYYMTVGFRHAVGQFSVLNLFYGLKFQKQMPILQL